MKTVKNSTITQGRMEQSIEHAINRVAGPQITQQINQAVEDERIRTGSVTKFYPYLDKAEVKLDHSGELVLCKILHRFGGELLDLYTPTADSVGYCDNLHEPCIFPREKLHCLIININDLDSDEHLLLGFTPSMNSAAAIEMTDDYLVIANGITISDTDDPDS